MLSWRRSRQWKRSAVEATSPVHFASERELAVAGITEQVLLLRGSRPGSEASSENPGTALQSSLAKVIDDDFLCASLTLKYFDVLENRLSRADYEDVHALRAEANWVNSNIVRKLKCPLVRQGEAGSGEGAGSASQRLYAAAAARVAAELAAAALAA